MQLSSPKLTHLPFLDGIRGIAAVYVVLGHAVMITTEPDLTPLRGVKHLLLQWTLYGQIAVAIFIVLSGFCLMLPVARSSEPFCGGLWQFIHRRCRRILPPYFAALCLSLLLIYLCGPSEAFRQQFSRASLVSHFFLLHNLKPAWNHAINSPMWSVATEWQIYFAFALILLPIQKMLGTMVATFVALVMGTTPHFLLRVYNFDWAHPWYLLLFAFGMNAAVLVQRNQTDHTLSFIRKWNNVLLGAGAFVLMLTFNFKSRFGNEIFLVGDSLEGLLMALLIVRLHQQCSAGKRSRLCQIFESKPAMFLGSISYSLYLVHWPLLCTLHFLIKCKMSANSELLLTLSGGFIVVGLAAYLFHLLFERPFLSSRKRNLEKSISTTIGQRQNKLSPTL